MMKGHGPWSLKEAERNAYSCQRCQWKTSGAVEKREEGLEGNMGIWGIYLPFTFAKSHISW